MVDITTDVPVVEDIKSDGLSDEQRQSVIDSLDKPTPVIDDALQSLIDSQSTTGLTDGVQSYDNVENNPSVDLNNGIDSDLNSIKAKSLARSAKSQDYTVLSGNIVKIVLEFPNFNNKDESVVINLDDVMTLSYSVYRAKPPVITLGQTSVTGFGLGAKTVAGSMIRSIFGHDKLSELQNTAYIANQQEMYERLKNIDGKMPTGMPVKEALAYMKDDLAYFNIHCVAITEAVAEETGEPLIRTDSIYGCMIMNNGQVFSIEDLITEGNFSFQAKNVKTSTDMTGYSSGFSSTPFYPSISSIMGGTND